MVKSWLKTLVKNQAPVSYTSDNSYIMFSMDKNSPSENYLRAYQKSGTVFGVVNSIVSPVSRVEWRMYRATQDNRVRYSLSDSGSDQRVEVLQHQALKVLSNPNPYMTTLELFEMSQLFLELTGESWWIIEYAGAIPTGIWPVRPDKMTPVPSPTNFIAGYFYDGPNGERVPFKPNEVVFCKTPNPLDMYRGQSPLQTVMSDIDAGNYAAQWNRNFFLNEADPGSIITAPNALTDEEFDTFTNRWRETHRGVSRAHRVALLESGMTWQAAGHANQTDMDFVNLVNNSRDKIREAYRIHPIMVGITDDVNRANAQTGEEVHLDNIVMPRLDRWSDVLNNKFLPLFGSAANNVEFDYVPPVAPNREQDNVELTSKSAAAQDLVDAGYDPHDVLEVVGLPDMGVVEKATQAPALPPGWVPGMPPAQAPAEPQQPAQPSKPGPNARYTNQIGEKHMEYKITNQASGPSQIAIYDDIGGTGIRSSDFVNDLRSVKGPLVVNINTQGGDVFEGMAIYTALARRPDVTVNIDGMAASAGSFIAQAASPGKLNIAKNGMMMIHEAHADIRQANARDATEAAGLLNKISDQIASIYSDRTGKPAAYWRGKMQDGTDGTWLSASEAVAEGLADNIIEGRTMNNAATHDATAHPGQQCYDPDNDGDCDLTAAGDTDHDYWSASGEQLKPVPGKPMSNLMPYTFVNASAPYGDVEYADPGYLDADGEQASKSGKEGVKRYPIDEEHVKAAWSYINQEKNASQYTPDQLASIKEKIKAAMAKYGHDVADNQLAKRISDSLKGILIG